MTGLSPAGLLAQRTDGREQNLAAVLDKSWWRWRESNPRPKRSPVGVYKLRLAF